MEVTCITLLAHYDVLLTQFYPLAGTDGATFLVGIIYHKRARTLTKSFIIASEHGDGLLRL